MAFRYPYLSALIAFALSVEKNFVNLGRMVFPHCWLLTGLFYHYFPCCQVGSIGSGRGRGIKKPRPGWRPGRPVVTEQQPGRVSRSRCGLRQLTAGPAPPSTTLGVRTIRPPCIRGSKYRRLKIVDIWFLPIRTANCGGQTSPHKNRN